MVAGCSTLQPPADVQLGGAEAPTRWAAAATATTPDATNLAVWWHRFGDSTLDGLIADALAANADIASAQASLQRSRALAAVAQAQRGPVVDATGSAPPSCTSAGGCRVPQPATMTISAALAQRRGAGQTMPRVCRGRVSAVLAPGQAT
jgi:outer membrane protein TolC